jgi:hypothetical protein
MSTSPFGGVHEKTKDGRMEGRKEEIKEGTQQGIQEGIGWVEGRTASFFFCVAVWFTRLLCAI